MKTSKLQIACPLCGSGEVFYTCTPNCCFNHVCAGCGATFQPVTRANGKLAGGVEPPDPLPDATDPTTACARCDSTAVYVTEEKVLVCANCGTLLALEITEIAAG